MPTLVIEADSVLDNSLHHIGNNIAVDTATGVVIGIDRGEISYAKTVKIKGYVFPGFIDAHIHLTGTGIKLLGASLENTRDPEEIGRLLAGVSGSIVYGRGWDQESFNTPGTIPTRRILDKYVQDRPAIAVRVCGHMAVANTLALRIVEPQKKYPKFVDAEKGILLEDAVEYTVNTLLERNGNTIEYVHAALKELAETGIAGLSSMSCTPSEYRSLITISRQRNILQKVSCYPDYYRINEFQEIPDPNISLAGIKLYADGSFGAHTAALEEPYADKETHGQLLLTSKEIEKIAREALSRNLRVAIHAIGDLAISEVLEAYERLGLSDHGRIEHFSLADDGDIVRASALGVHIVVQPYFRIGDWWLDKRLGIGRALETYRYRTMLRNRVKLSFSTDSPVDPYQPWETLRAAYSDCDTILCNENESLSPKEAFKAYTIMAAKASGGTVSELGKLEVNTNISSIAWSPNDPSNKEWRGPARLLPLVLQDKLL
ncbi:MAG: amidohydrolase family protein [Desulfurococcales archaeon]|nr:amidohydrolase family protein [Desulfurococcales archaeon]